MLGKSPEREERSNIFPNQLARSYQLNGEKRLKSLESRTSIQSRHLYSYQMQKPDRVGSALMMSTVATATSQGSYQSNKMFILIHNNNKIDRFQEMSKSNADRDLSGSRGEKINKQWEGFDGEKRKKKGNSCTWKSQSMQVHVRVRPLNSKEQIGKNGGKKVVRICSERNWVIVSAAGEGTGKNPQVGASREDKIFEMSSTFGEEITNESVFERAMKEDMRESLMEGFNCTCFVYGMTGAGKTYTMFGDICNYMTMHSNVKGLIMLSLREIMKLVREKREAGQVSIKLRLSYLEIYNEQIGDLLSPVQNNDNLMVIEDPSRGVFVPDLTENEVVDEQHVLESIRIGNTRRQMASTSQNEFSSRSHAILTFTIEQTSIIKSESPEEGTKTTITTSKLCLVDLAGSERAAVSENRGIRMLEGANINRSLLALGNCINILGDTTKKGAFVPYRDSKLTRLLKDSLGGNTKTYMIACVSPALIAFEETLNTLKYAQRARNIQKRVMKNEKAFSSLSSLKSLEYIALIDNLKREIEFLKTQLATTSQTSSPQPAAFCYGAKPMLSSIMSSQQDLLESCLFSNNLDKSDNKVLLSGRDQGPNESRSQLIPSEIGISGAPILQTQNQASSAFQQQQFQPWEDNESLTSSGKSIRISCVNTSNNGSVILFKRSPSQLNFSKHQLAHQQKTTQEMQQLSGKILKNLEENWEIQQSIAELNSLRKQNEEIMEEKQQRLQKLRGGLIQWPHESEISTLQVGISQLQQNMSSNELILENMRQALRRNEENKHGLQQEMISLLSNSSEQFLKTMSQTCQVLQIEKNDLENANLEMKQKHLHIQSQFQEKVDQIRTMEEQIKQMQKELEEKNQIIQQNQQIILHLASTTTSSSSFSNVAPLTLQSNKGLALSSFSNSNGGATLSSTTTNSNGQFPSVSNNSNGQVISSANNSNINTFSFTNNSNQNTLPISNSNTNNNLNSHGMHQKQRSEDMNQGMFSPDPEEFLLNEFSSNPSKRQFSSDANPNNSINNKLQIQTLASASSNFAQSCQANALRSTSSQNTSNKKFILEKSGYFDFKNKANFPLTTSSSSAAVPAQKSAASFQKNHLLSSQNHGMRNQPTSPQMRVSSPTLISKMASTLSSLPSKKPFEGGPVMTHLHQQTFSSPNSGSARLSTMYRSTGPAITSSFVNRQSVLTQRDKTGVKINSNPGANYPVLPPTNGLTKPDNVLNNGPSMGLTLTSGSSQTKKLQDARNEYKEFINIFKQIQEEEETVTPNKKEQPSQLIAAKEQTSQLIAAKEQTSQLISAEKNPSSLKGLETMRTEEDQTDDHMQQQLNENNPDRSMSDFMQTDEFPEFKSSGQCDELRNKIKPYSKECSPIIQNNSIYNGIDPILTASSFHNKPKSPFNLNQQYPLSNSSSSSSLHKSSMNRKIADLASRVQQGALFSSQKESNIVTPDHSVSIHKIDLRTVPISNAGLFGSNGIQLNQSSFSNYNFIQELIRLDNIVLSNQITAQNRQEISDFLLRAQQPPNSQLQTTSSEQAALVRLQQAINEPSAQISQFNTSQRGKSFGQMPVEKENSRVSQNKYSSVSPSKKVNQYVQDVIEKQKQKRTQEFQRHLLLTNIASNIFNPSDSEGKATKQNPTTGSSAVVPMKASPTLEGPKTASSAVTVPTTSVSQVFSSGQHGIMQSPSHFNADSMSAKNISNKTNKNNIIQINLYQNKIYTGNHGIQSPNLVRPPSADQSIVPQLGKDYSSGLGNINNHHHHYGSNPSLAKPQPFHSTLYQDPTQITLHDVYKKFSKFN